MVHRIWNGNTDYKGIPIRQFEDDIVIGDNVVLGGNNIILAGITSVMMLLWSPGAL